MDWMCIFLYFCFSLQFSMNSKCWSKHEIYFASRWLPLCVKHICLLVAFAIFKVKWHEKPKQNLFVTNFRVKLTTAINHLLCACFFESLIYNWIPHFNKNLLVTNEYFSTHTNNKSILVLLMTFFCYKLKSYPSSPIHTSNRMFRWNRFSFVDLNLNNFRLRSVR